MLEKVLEDRNDVVISLTAPQLVRCWSSFVDLAAFGLLVSRDRTKRLDPKRTAMTVFGNSRKLVSDLSLLLTRQRWDPMF